MSDKLRKCPACGGLGYFRCDCWPGDCICGQDEETCFECEGEGLIDPTWDDDFGVPFEDDASPPPVESAMGTPTPDDTGKRGME
jgi:hypothetical protein